MTMETMTLEEMSVEGRQQLAADIEATRAIEEYQEFVTALTQAFHAAGVSVLEISGPQSVYPDMSPNEWLIFYKRFEITRGLPNGEERLEQMAMLLRSVGFNVPEYTADMPERTYRYVLNTVSAAISVVLRDRDILLANRPGKIQIARSLSA